MNSSEDRRPVDYCIFHRRIVSNFGFNKEVTQKKGREITVSPYKQQVNQLMYRIPIYKPSHHSSLIGVISHPSYKMKYLGYKTIVNREIFEQIIVDSVGKLFEIENPRYYHGSVRQYLKVKFIR